MNFVRLALVGAERSYAGPAPELTVLYIQVEAAVGEAGGDPLRKVLEIDLDRNDGGVGHEGDGYSRRHFQKVDVFWRPVAEALEVHALIGLGSIGEHFPEKGEVGGFCENVIGLGKG